MSMLKLRDVYLRERQLTPSIHQTLWQTNTFNTVLTTKTSYVDGYYFAEMSLDTPEYSLVVKESLEKHSFSDTKVTFVRIWANSVTTLMTVMVPIIQEIRELLYPETVVYSSIGHDKNTCTNFEIAPEFVQRLFYS